MTDWGGYTIGRPDKLPTNMTKDAAIKMLRAELEDVLSWALTEKAPLREQEIESIRKVLAGTKGAK